MEKDFLHCSRSSLRPGNLSFRRYIYPTDHWIRHGPKNKDDLNISGLGHDSNVMVSRNL